MHLLVSYLVVPGNREKIRNRVLLTIAGTLEEKLRESNDSLEQRVCFSLCRIVNVRIIQKILNAK